MSIDYQFHRSIVATYISNTDDKIEAIKAINGATSDADAINKVNSIAGFDVYSQSTIITTVTTDKIDNGAVTSDKIANGSITNADINSAAAIDYSKLNVPAAAIVYSKLSLASSITSGDITDLTIATADIADSAVTSAKIANDAIMNADINTAAAIAFSKISMLSWKSSGVVSPYVGGSTCTASITTSNIGYSSGAALSALQVVKLAGACGTCTALNDVTGCIDNFVQ